VARNVGSGAVSASIIRGDKYSNKAWRGVLNDSLLGNGGDYPGVATMWREGETW